MPISSRVSRIIAVRLSSPRTTLPAALRSHLPGMNDFVSVRFCISILPSSPNTAILDDQPPEPVRQPVAAHHALAGQDALRRVEHRTAPSELIKESDVVLVEISHVIDAVLDHRDTLNAHAETRSRCRHVRVDAASRGARSGAPFRRRVSRSSPRPCKTLQPLPPQTKQETSTSADGSVNGKWCGLNLIWVDSPNIVFAKVSSVPLRSPIVIPLSTTSPSS